ncbi:hypothetical protein QFC21_005560 [Naganishia friedmannii]|uniref:Uncharacterized protein n=1 Tax=Naganishia friedmannii TaxID=89922 RepID=A0ACC2V9E0_9TREE|nr:hypothetical protein QFC21_005560 [Naganishia friedmannii]
MVTQDLATEDRAYRKPISSMYVKDQTSITGEIDDSFQTSYTYNKDRKKRRRQMNSNLDVEQPSATRKLGVGSGDVVGFELRAFQLSLYHIGSLPRMEANIQARKDACFVPRGDPGTSTSPTIHPLSETVCAWLMNGPGHFMGLRCYQKIHVQLMREGLKPLRYLGDVLQYADAEKADISLEDLLDKLFSQPTARLNPVIPMEEGEFKVWFAAILWKVEEARAVQTEEIFAEYTLSDEPQGSLTLMEHRDLEGEARSCRKPISSMYLKDATDISWDTNDHSLCTFSRIVSYSPSQVKAAFTIGGIVPKVSELYDEIKARLTIETLPPASFARGTSTVGKESLATLSDCTLVTWFSLQESANSDWIIRRLGPPLPRLETPA